VVVKTALRDPTFIMKEGLTIWQLTHPNVVTLLGAVLVDNPVSGLLDMSFQCLLRVSLVCLLLVWLDSGSRDNRTVLQLQAIHISNPRNRVTLPIVNLCVTHGVWTSYFVNKSSTMFV